MRTLLSSRFVAASIALLAAAACSDASSSAPANGAGESAAGPAGPSQSPGTTPAAVPPGADPIAPAAAPAIDTDPSHYPRNVWITSAMAKVRRQDGVPATAKHWAILAAARNESESFQVHVAGDGKALSDVSIEVSDLVGARAGGKIAAADAITVSRELYLDIPADKKSDANGISGAVPDGLLPARDVFFGETRKAFPVQVNADATASAWIDVRVAPGTPADFYVGQVRVLAAGNAVATMPIRLKVWNVDLPSTSSLRTNFGMSWANACIAHFGSYDACGAAAGAGASPDDGVEAMHTLYARFALDHRVSLGGVVYAPPRGNWAHFDAVYGPLLDGTAPTQLAGAKLTSINYAGPTDAASLADWAQHFRAKGWLDRLVFYHCDEPASGNSCNFQQAFDEESAVHAAAGDMRTLLTADIESIASHGLLDTVDVLTPVVDQMQPHGEASHRPKYDDFLKRSPQKALYWYQSCDEHESCDRNGSPGGASATWPSYMADASPMRNRVFQWMAYVFDVQGELYYLTDLCFDGSCGGSHDPLQSIYAFSGHGDGTLYYPGKPSFIGGQHDIPLSSIRFELIREGLEDYELLHLLDAAGDGAFVRSSIATFVRRADDFDSDPARLEAVREMLGDRLHARSLVKP